MANNWVVTFLIEDEKKQRAKWSFHLNKGMPVTQFSEDEFTLDDDAERYVSVMALLLDAIIVGRIVKATISREVNFFGIPDLKTAALPGSDIEEGLYTLYRTEAGPTYGHTIPTIREDVFVNGVFDELTDITDGNASLPVMWLPDPLQAYQVFRHLWHYEEAEFGYDWSLGAVDARGERLFGTVKQERSFKKSRR